MSAAVTWGPLAGVGQIIGLEIKIRPLDYDHKLSCPPEIGVEPWWASTIVEMPISRSVNSTIHFTCKGELMKASLAVNQTIRIKSGNITCDNSSGSPSWANMTHLPCQLTCPANYNLSANGSFCYNFTQVESQNGILGASLICKKDNASLGLISSMADTSLAKLNTEYYTAHIVVNGTIRPPLPNNNSEQVLNNEQCITLIGSEGGDLAEWDFSSCYGRNSLKAFCTLPAYCPEGFTSYRGLCYIVVNNYSPLDSFPDALVSCHSEGAGLAYPESRDTLKFLVGLIKTSGIINGTYSTKDEVNVLIGLNDIDENWSLHGIYNPDEYIINAAGKSDKKKHYRYLSGPLADSKNMTLKHSLLFAEADIHGANS
ncbi:hypothetical protein SK128_005026 [Halocaridina rubra]|uniref:C-type lectin domain-containing protein n=1 Tax=Halocaridina rubra TaxID=373956 RepID=A0AAN9A1L9_HALRR